MSDETPQADAPPPPSPAQIAAMLDALPGITTGLDAGACAERAERLSKRGKLPGFAPSADTGVLFSCAAFGAPFDYRLSAKHADGEIGFTAERLRKLPTIYAVVIALTIWPGVVFTDSLLNTWFGWYPNPWWFTWAWYIPLTALPVPWMWRSLTRKSRASALVHAHEQIAKLAAAFDGELTED